MALNNLSSVGLQAVYASNGDPFPPFAMGTDKINREPWRYIRYMAEKKEKEKGEEFINKKHITKKLDFNSFFIDEENSSASSFEVSGNNNTHTTFD